MRSKAPVSPDPWRWLPSPEVATLTNFSGILPEILFCALTNTNAHIFSSSHVLFLLCSLHRVPGRSAFIRKYRTALFSVTAAGHSSSQKHQNSYNLSPLGDLLILWPFDISDNASVRHSVIWRMCEPL